MFHPQAGYYQQGRVTIGMFQDYWTYPVRMAPVFGELLALRVLDVWRVVGQTVAAQGMEFFIVELGGGRGELLRDCLDSLAKHAVGDHEAAALLRHVRAVVLDRSDALMEDQAGAQRRPAVSHIHGSAQQLADLLPDPFNGVIFANELLDVAPAEVLQITAERVARLMVQPWCSPRLSRLTAPRPQGMEPAGIPSDFRPLKPERLPDLMTALNQDGNLLQLAASGDLLCMAGAFQELGEIQDLEGDLGDFLRASLPAIRRLSTLGEPHTRVVHAPAGTQLLDHVARVLSRGSGAFITIDYGGTGYHLFDQYSRLPHLRTYSRALDGKEEGVDEYSGQVHNPFRAPGCEDITFDVDFTWAATRLRDRGLDIAFFGSQAALETGVDLWSPPYRQRLETGRHKEGFTGIEAIKQAYLLLSGFRMGAGFRLLIATTPGLDRAFTGLGRSDPLQYGELVSVARDLDAEALREAVGRQLQTEGLDQEEAEILAGKCMEALHPTGSVVDDLGDHLLYGWRWPVIEELRKLKKCRVAT